MTQARKLFSILLLLTVSAALFSCSRGGKPDLSFRAERMVGSGDIAIFMLIINSGDGADTLTGCSLKEFPTVRGEIHDVKDGVMHQIKEIKVPSKGMAVLEAGSLHLMFFGLPENLGRELTVVMNFERSGTREIKVKTPSESP